MTEYRTGMSWNEWFTAHRPSAAIACRRCGVGPGVGCKDLRWPRRHPERLSDFPHRERVHDWAEQKRYADAPVEIEAMS